MILQHEGKNIKHYFTVSCEYIKFESFEYKIQSSLDEGNMKDNWKNEKQTFEVKFVTVKMI